MNMVKVRLINCSVGSAFPGDVTEIEESHAKQLIAIGKAKLVEEKPPEAPPEEIEEKEEKEETQPEEEKKDAGKRGGRGK